MPKNPNFIGQPIFSFLLNFIDRSEIAKAVKNHQSDYYTKKFDTYTHLVSMLYCVLHSCSSIREVTTGMQVCFNKLNHLGVNYCPRRSTLSDANRKRDSAVFEQIYYDLYKKLGGSLSDSRNNSNLDSRLYIIDSTTISLFKEILKNAGRNPSNGKRKGGLKVHALIKADEDVPCLIKMNAGASHDVGFIKNLKLPKGSIVTFDKGYIDYKQYELWTTQEVDWVTRTRVSASIEVHSENLLTKRSKAKGILSDQRITLGHKTTKAVTRTEARRIIYWDDEKQKEYSFITNNKKLKPEVIALIYKKRWQIELLFKRIKQNYPLQYFLGDNENALKVQVWCVLIADLLLKYVKSKLIRKWSYANLKSMIRLHLMSYINLIKFLENPDTALINTRTQKSNTINLFSSA